MCSPVYYGAPMRRSHCRCRTPPQPPTPSPPLFPASDVSAFKQKHLNIINRLSFDLSCFPCMNTPFAVQWLHFTRRGNIERVCGNFYCQTLEKKLFQTGQLNEQPHISNARATKRAYWNRVKATSLWENSSKRIVSIEQSGRKVVF